MSDLEQFDNQAADDLAAETFRIGQRWVNTPYYSAAESAAESQWQERIKPFLNPHDVDYSATVELACGHGRMTKILKRFSGTVRAVDMLPENIDFCRARFADVPNVSLIQNDGVSLAAIETGSASFFFCWDSMVHFDSDVVRRYLREIHRILKPGGLGFCHHSNYDKAPTGDFQRTPHARNFMTRALFEHYAGKEGLEIAAAKVINWGGGDNFMPEHDCLSLVRKPV